MEDVVSEVKFETVCRLCLSSDKKLLCIFSTKTLPNKSEWTLAKKIFDSTSLQVIEHDELPSKICTECNDLVEKLHSFKRQCLNSDVTLRDQLKKKKTSEQVKNKGGEVGEQTSDKSANAKTDGDVIIISNGDRIGSPPPNANWKSEAVDVEVKVEIRENSRKPAKKPASRKRKKPDQSDKMTISSFPCSKCTKVFAHKNSLTRHELSHTDEQYICFYCNKRLTTRETLLRHVKAHSGQKRYKCEHCENSYTSSTSYSSHVRKHTGERPYKCPQCKESFHLSSSLDRHAAKHSGTKAYVCEVCEAAFWVADDLRSHVNRMH